MYIKKENKRIEILVEIGIKFLWKLESTDSDSMDSFDSIQKTPFLLVMKKKKKIRVQ